MNIKGKNLAIRMPFVVVLVVVATIFIATRMDLLKMFYEVWKNFYEVWKNLSPVTRELVTVLVAVVGTFLALVVAVTVGVLTLRQTKRFFGKQQKEARILKDELAFPFEVFSSSELDKLKKWLLGREDDIEYLPRFTDPRQQNFEKQLDAKFLLVTGRAGLGKTRECIEMIGRLAKRKGEEVTVLCPSVYMDVPSNLPADVQRAHNIVLLINDVHRQCASGSSPSLDPETRTYHDRLADTVEFLKEQFEGQDFRVVITARNDPDLKKRLKLEGQFWKPFKQYPLPGVHKAVRPQFIERVAKHFNLSLDRGAVDYVVKRSDGTCAGIVTALKRESDQRSGKPANVTIEDLQGYNFRYPIDWEEQVYKKDIAPFAARRAVFEAMATLYDLRILQFDFLVICLASCLWPGRLGLFKRKRIKKAFQRELQAWIFEYKGDYPALDTKGFLC